uniref:Endonuclease/exonuclease/phosphatase n=1 Tax=Heterorhabditis bacteriophora TaxID=37862 RepID=A0A1I7WAM0_HETBA
MLSTCDFNSKENLTIVDRLLGATEVSSLVILGYTNERNSFNDEFFWMGSVRKQGTTDVCISENAAYRNTVSGEFLRKYWSVDVTLIRTNSKFKRSIDVDRLLDGQPNIESTEEGRWSLRNIRDQIMQLRASFVDEFVIFDLCLLFVYYFAGYYYSFIDYYILWSERDRSWYSQVDCLNSCLFTAFHIFVSVPGCDVPGTSYMVTGLHIPAPYAATGSDDPELGSSVISFYHRRSTSSKTNPDWVISSLHLFFLDKELPVISKKYVSREPIRGLVFPQPSVRTAFENPQRGKLLVQLALFGASSDL